MSKKVQKLFISFIFAKLIPTGSESVSRRANQIRNHVDPNPNTGNKARKR